MNGKNHYCVYCSDLNQPWTVWADTADEAERLAIEFGHRPYAIHQI